MPRANIYQGQKSCYARNEGVWVPGRGVNRYNAPSFIYLILRDLRRGWTYDHSCRRIRMTPALARKRIRYLIPLAKKHYGEEEARAITPLVEEVAETLRLPRELLKYVRLAGPNAKRVMPKIPIVARIPILRRRRRAAIAY